MCLCHIKLACAVPLMNGIKTKGKARSRMPHVYFTWSELIMIMSGWQPPDRAG